MNTSPEQIDALRELVNIGVGRAAGILNEMLHAHIRLSVPQIEVLTVEEFESRIEGLGGGITAAVQVSFRGAFRGAASLVFSQESANKLVDLLTGQGVDDGDYDEVKSGALSEIGNIVINGVMGSISNMLDAKLEYSIPSYVEEEHAIRSALRESKEYEVILLGNTQFEVTGHVIRGEVLLVFEIGSFKAFLDAVDHTISETSLSSQ